MFVDFLTSVFKILKVNDPYEEIFGNNLWHKFSVFRLTKIMRQSSVSFQTALNNLAVGEMTDADIRLLQSRQYCSLPNNVPLDNAIHLFATNGKVDEFNSECVGNITGLLVQCKASDILGLSLIHI